MSRFRVLSDVQWSLIEDLLPVIICLRSRL